MPGPVVVVAAVIGTAAAVLAFKHVRMSDGVNEDR